MVRSRRVRWSNSAESSPIHGDSNSMLGLTELGAGAMRHTPSATSLRTVVNLADRVGGTFVCGPAPGGVLGKIPR